MVESANHSKAKDAKDVSDLVGNPMPILMPCHMLWCQFEQDGNWELCFVFSVRYDGAKRKNRILDLEVISMNNPKQIKRFYDPAGNSDPHGAWRMGRILDVGYSRAASLIVKSILRKGISESIMHTAWLAKALDKGFSCGDLVYVLGTKDEDTLIDVVDRVPYEARHLKSYKDGQLGLLVADESNPAYSYGTNEVFPLGTKPLGDTIVYFPATGQMLAVDSSRLGVVVPNADSTRTIIKSLSDQGVNKKTFVLSAATDKKGY